MISSISGSNSGIRNVEGPDWRCPNDVMMQVGLVGKLGTNLRFAPILSVGLEDQPELDSPFASMVGLVKRYRLDLLLAIRSLKSEVKLEPDSFAMELAGEYGLDLGITAMILV